MNDKEDHIKRLLERWMQDNITPAEKGELVSLLQEQTLLSDIEPSLQQIWNAQISQSVFSEDETAIMIERILSEHPVEKEDTFTPSIHRVHFLRKWGWAAASVILLFGVGAYLWTTSKKSTQPAIVMAETAGIAPGKNGAILTLANGTQVVLDSLGNGVIASQNGTQVRLTDGGLAYDPSRASSGEIVYNTMTTPKGRQFQVTLPDGTKVWLNSASSIHYPTVFVGSERKVTVTGEAYFEVAKNAKMPFKLNVNNNAEVEVLGTHFNVNAYDNEASINTTLLEGSVSVNATIIRPGQQAQVAGNNVRVMSHVDLDKVMAWKNGLFNFEGATLNEIMRQLERWYDIEVAYEKGIPDIRFEGKMTRDISLNGLLNALKRSDVHFRIEGRKLIVLP